MTFKKKKKRNDLKYKRKIILDNFWQDDQKRIL